LTVDNITINDAVISSDTGAISFSNENLTTTGNLTATLVTATGASGFTASNNANLTMGSGAGASFGSVRIDAGGTDAGLLFLFGSVSSGTGAALTLYGNSHAGNPGDFTFHAGGFERLSWDNSVTTLTLLTGDFIITAGDLIMTTPTTPASSVATGTIGTVVWDTGFLYVCTATNTWERVAIASW
jgi:hypothetical protein